jgi:hypothetical protein
VITRPEWLPDPENLRFRRGGVSRNPPLQKPRLLLLLAAKTFCSLQKPLQKPRLLLLLAHENPLAQSGQVAAASAPAHQPIKNHLRVGWHSPGAVNGLSRGLGVPRRRRTRPAGGGKSAARFPRLVDPRAEIRAAAGPRAAGSAARQAFASGLRRGTTGIARRWPAAADGQLHARCRPCPLLERCAPPSRRPAAVRWGGGGRRALRQDRQLPFGATQSRRRRHCQPAACPLPARCLPAAFPLPSRCLPGATPSRRPPAGCPLCAITR